MSSNAQEILTALGGPQNVQVVEPCITRLRVEVVDPSVVDEQGLRDAGAFGVVLQGFVVQVVIGPDADDLYREMLPLMV
ncbi:PTS glucose/sucrose transporter subunit IIB [Actinomycetaceae bacterium L2_0104]